MQTELTIHGASSLAIEAGSRGGTTWLKLSIYVDGDSYPFHTVTLFPVEGQTGGSLLQKLRASLPAREPSPDRAWEERRDPMPPFAPHELDANSTDRRRS